MAGRRHLSNDRVLLSISQAHNCYRNRLIIRKAFFFLGFKVKVNNPTNCLTLTMWDVNQTKNYNFILPLEATHTVAIATATNAFNGLISFASDCKFLLMDPCRPVTMATKGTLLVCAS